MTHTRKHKQNHHWTSMAAGLILGFLLFVVLFFMASMDTYGKEEQRVIRVGYMGIGAVLPDGKGGYSGYTVDYLDEIAQYTDWEYEYVYASWADCMKMLETGELDLMSMVRHTEEREETFLFSELSMADDYTALLAAADSDVYYKDYEAFDGKRVGVVAGTIYEEAFVDYAKIQGFGYHIVHYMTAEDAGQAVLDGEIDFFATGGVSSRFDLKVVDQFSLERAYFVTGKQNRKLMDALDEAIQMVRIEHPELVGELTEKYYGADSRATDLHFTREEQEYIDAAGPITIKGFAGKRPLAYRESREYVGILPDYIRMISECCGLEFRFAVTGSASMEEHMHRMKEEVYLLLYADISVDDASLEDGIIMTDALFDSSLAYVKRKGTEGQQEGDGLTFALSGEMYFLEDMIYAENPNYAVKYYDSSAACMDAVISGEANVTMMDEYIASYLLQKPKYADNLAKYEGRDIATGLCLYASEEQEILVRILNKTIRYLEGETQTRAISEAVMAHSYVYEMDDFLYEYGKWVLSISILFILIIVLGVLLFSRIRKFRTQEREKKALQELIQLDRLTGVYSRSYFFEQAEVMIQEGGDDLCIVRLNVQRFNIINELYGSDKGDYLLQLMGHDLKEMGEQMGFIVGRFTADHFYLCMRQQTFEEIGFPRQSPAEWLGMDVKLTYGVYPVGSQKDVPVSVMCDRADMANRDSGSAVGEYISYYSDEDRQKTLREQEIENEMEKAVEERQFCIYIQPKYDIETAEIVGGEALVRWNHPEKGMIPPGHFIGLFERNGFIRKLDYFVWEEACRFLAETKQNGHRIYPISVNVSKLHFYGTALIDKLSGLISQYGLEPSDLELEVTESVCAEDPDVLFDICDELRGLGFKIAMDDFGSGFSSLNMLKEMPLDILKMDMRFLSSAGEEEQMQKGRSILCSLIEMAHSLGLQVVVEGVETEEQAAFIRKTGNCAVQGYYFSRPVDSDSYDAMLAAMHEEEEINTAREEYGRIG